MILHCSFEELSAATAAAERVLEGTGAGGVAAPPQVVSDIESILPRLVGDMSVETLADARSIERALVYVLDETRRRTDVFILEQHPAAEAAVASFFDYAHILTLLDRARRISEEMAALIELMSGAPPTAETATRFQFPDE